VAVSISGLGEAIIRATLARSCAARAQLLGDEGPAATAAALLQATMTQVGAWGLGGRALGDVSSKPKNEIARKRRLCGHMAQGATLMCTRNAVSCRAKAVLGRRGSS
jgi:hypothetical protein